MIKKMVFWVLFLILLLRPSSVNANTTYSSTDYVVIHSSLQKSQKINTVEEMSGFVQNFVQSHSCQIKYTGLTFTTIHCPKSLNLSSTSGIVPDQIDQLLPTHPFNSKINYKNKHTHTTQLHRQFGIRGAEARIAVLDSGAKIDHPELASHIVGGKNFLSEDEYDLTDPIGHGTHVAGIIAATGIDAQAQGVAPAATLWIGKVCNESGGCSVSTIMTAIEYIVQHQLANTINMSIGGKGTKAENCDDLGDGDELHVAYMQLVNWAVEQGVSIVASAGNDYGGDIRRPACASKAIAVGSTNEQNAISDFSSHGKALDIVAPGENIYSTYLNSKYTYLSGTSMAAPVVSGIVATMKSLNTFSQDEITHHLYSTARDLSVSPQKQGHGLLHAFFAVNNLCKTKPCYRFQTIEWDFRQSVSPIAGFAVTKKKLTPLKKGPNDETSLFFNSRKSVVKIFHNPFFYFQNWHFTWKLELSPTHLNRDQIVFSNYHSEKGGYELRILKGGKLQYTLQDATKHQVVFQTLEKVITANAEWQTIELRHNSAPSLQHFGVDIFVNGQDVGIKTKSHSSTSQIDAIQVSKSLLLGNDDSKRFPFRGYVKNFSISRTGE